jgi:hypothetical protein
VNNEQTIGKISEIRVANNAVWMRLLELALRAAPSEAKALVAEINENDQKVSALVKELLT